MEMESIEGAQVRSIICGTENEFGDDVGLPSMMTVAPETGSSFTALLELPANQAVELLVHSPETENLPATKVPEIEPQRSFYPRCPPPPIFPSDIALIDRASKFSVFAGNSPETSSIPSNSSWKPNFVKQEPLESDSNPNSSPAVSNPTVNQNQKSTKRKDREKKVIQRIPLLRNGNCMITSYIFLLSI